MLEIFYRCDDCKVEFGFSTKEDVVAVDSTLKQHLSENADHVFTVKVRWK